MTYKRKEVIEGATLYLGDCLEILPTLEKVDAVVTDPPYGVRFSSGWDNKFKDVEIENDGDITARDMALNCFPEIPAIVFGSWKKEKPAGTRALLIWNKGTVGMGDLNIPWFPSTEEIYVIGHGFSGSRVSSVLSFPVRNNNHPTEKPVALIEHLASRCPSGCVLDPFMGSGTTGVACANLGRKFIGIEINEAYFNIAVERIENAYRQSRLFA